MKQLIDTETVAIVASVGLSLAVTIVTSLILNERRLSHIEGFVNSMHEDLAVIKKALIEKGVNI